jgi:hypothetical protein
MCAYILGTVGGEEAGWGKPESQGNHFAGLHHHLMLTLMSWPRAEREAEGDHL